MALRAPRGRPLLPPGPVNTSASGSPSGESAGDGVGDRAGEWDDADACRALRPVLVAGAERAGVVAHLQDLKLPAVQVHATGAQAEQLAGAQAGPDQADEAVERRGAGEQVSEFL